MRILTIVLASAAVGLACGACATAAQRASLSAADVTAIRALDRAYAEAWLRDDTAAVLATLAPDAVLMPAGARPVAGQDAIRRFWWPADGSRTRVTAYRTTVDEVSGAGPLAYVRGSGTLSFTYERDTVRTAQTSRTMTLTVVARQPDGSWRIHRRMWGALAP